MLDELKTHRPNLNLPEYSKYVETVIGEFRTAGRAVFERYEELRVNHPTISDDDLSQMLQSDPQARGALPANLRKSAGAVIPKLLALREEWPRERARRKDARPQGDGGSAGAARSRDVPASTSTTSSSLPPSASGVHLASTDHGTLFVELLVARNRDLESEVRQLRSRIATFEAAAARGRGRSEAQRGGTGSGRSEAQRGGPGSGGSEEEASRRDSDSEYE